MLKEVKRDFSYYVFSFFIISTSMWIMEMIYSLVIRSKLINPGVLFGPWCPIYGTGYLFCLLFINKKDNKILNFIKMFIILGLVEYITSYLVEVIINKLVWDYSIYALNINGRVCLHMSIIFAVIGYTIIYGIEPLMKKLYNHIDLKAKYISYIALIIFIFDIFISWF